MFQNAREIQLSQEMIALVSDKDYDNISAFNWSAARGRNYRLVAMRTDRSGARQKTVLMHRSIIGENNIPDGFVIDHINGDSLDNRRENLRICERGQNMKNCKKYRNNQTGFIGVHYNRRLQKWNAKINSNGEQYWLGTFNSPKEAATVYDEAAKELHGEFATINFAYGSERP